MGRHAACMGPMRNVYSFSKEAIREEPFRICKCSKEDNIKMSLTEIIYDFMDWIQMAQNVV